MKMEVQLNQNPSTAWFMTNECSTLPLSFQCRNLLNLLGTPCIESGGEAEALCAWLDLHQVKRESGVEFLKTMGCMMDEWKWILITGYCQLSWYTGHHKPITLMKGWCNLPVLELLNGLKESLLSEVKPTAFVSGLFLLWLATLRYKVQSVTCNQLTVVYHNGSLYWAWLANESA